MRYGKDFYIDGSFVYNFSGFSVTKAKYIAKIDNYPNPPKCKLFKAESALVRFYKKSNERIRYYEKIRDTWYETYYEPCNDRFYNAVNESIAVEE